ncbi:MAG: NADH-quinone oxidoreductase subunit N [Buchnera aphidicola (Brevicoryne brassicae)]|uniref:NADH-quinone oxidoreductase subunit N n=1 Tax=Buchnera aphidicola (Brevicoryne brassicae) TaxID=911343 RepID=A0AAJ5TXI2_9GAMM|nr:NADH-quinone oxidoreductase subunit N [Buchnera aphidicola]QCI19744.1 NADH-quinone oxidoreductase subunit N [Buchnera aphidicola (Brevicoryne brassicae)]WAI19114.1 MAG: NADH-quinone oxidoreductase subunit N [Buchnera aphidicola (Brevicoryne brassicae)]
MIINIQQLTAFLPFFIVIFSLTTVILSISYSRNHFFTAVFVILSFIAVFFSLFFLTSQVPLDVGILFHIDGYSIFYIGMIIIASISTCVFSYPSLVRYPYNKEEFYLLILISNLGAILSIVSNHMSSLFINIEIMSIPMFGLIAYFNNKKHSLESAFKYVILSSIASSFLLLGISWVYSISGNLSFSSINHVLNIISLNEKLVVVFGIIMILISLFFKLSIVPFHLWTPDVYQGTPSVVLSFFSTVGKISTFGILLHFLSHISSLNNNILYFLLSLITIFSMLIGNLMALFQNNLKRFFGYSSISQLGYLFVVLLVSKNNYLLSLEASSIYLCGYLFSNIAYFGIINLVSNFYNNSVNSISSYKGFFWSEPGLSSILTLVLLSLAGFPMTLGFIGKFYILSIIIKEHLWIVGISFLVSTILGFYCYLRIIINLYLDPSNILLGQKLNIFKNWLYAPSAIIIFFSAMIILILGVYPNPLINFIKLMSFL